MTPTVEEVGKAVHMDIDAMAVEIMRLREMIVRANQRATVQREINKQLSATLLRQRTDLARLQRVVKRYHDQQVRERLALEPERIDVIDGDSVTTTLNCRACGQSATMTVTGPGRAYPYPFIEHQPGCFYRRWVGGVNGG